MNGICKLCNIEKDLIKRSHLFPNFLYKGITDEKNRLNVISSSTPFQKKKIQTGAYEEYILCSDCDNNILSKIERYANNHFYSQPYREDNKNFQQIINIHGLEFIRCKNIDYKGFKLFLESLLWRASVSTHELFQNFKLSKKHEEDLRNSIFNSTPLDIDDYACIMFTHQNQENVNTDLIFVNATNPQKVSFFINQFIYQFYLNKQSVEEATREILLNKNNEMGILKLPEKEWTKMRKSIFHSVAKLSIRNLNT